MRSWKSSGIKWHKEVSKNWGYKKYFKYIKKQSIDEMKHGRWPAHLIQRTESVMKVCAPFIADRDEWDRN